jgi:hypothetical protein
MDPLGVLPRKVEQCDPAIAEAAEARAADAERVEQRREIFGQVVVGAKRRGRTAAVAAVVLGQHAVVRRERRQRLAPIGFERIERAIQQDQRFAAFGHSI